VQQQQQQGTMLKALWESRRLQALLLERLLLERFLLLVLCTQRALEHGETKTGKTRCLS
jgi:hypothetical protein